MLPVILIPIYEPQDKTVQFFEALRKTVSYPIVIVDDGSGPDYQDKFSQMKQCSDDLKKDSHFFTYAKNQGKGYALKFGITQIQTIYPDTIGIVTADGDGQHSIPDIISLVEKLQQVSSDTLLLGVRSFKKEETPKKSYFGNRLTSLFYYLASGIKLEDTQTGLRGFKQEQFNALKQISGNRFEYEMNVLLQVASLGLTIEITPIETIYENNNEQSHFRAVQDSVLIYRPLISFLLSSLFSALVDVSLFMLFSLFLDKKTALLLFIATILARLLSGVVNYFLNKTVVFKDKDTVKKSMWKYFFLFCCQMILSWLGVVMLSSFIGSLLMAKLIIDTLLFLSSFSIQKRFIF